MPKFSLCKKLLTGATFLLLLVNMPTAWADTVTLDTNLSDSESFDVGEILSVGEEGDEDSQGQPYFEDGADAGAPILLFILDIINFITRLIGTIAMVLIILGGLMMIASEGDENRIQKGKGILEAAIIGLIISLFSYVIVRFVQSLFYLE
jgi:hypothetical protein